MPGLSDRKLLDGVCCQYCIYFEKPECPIKEASPWSRWGNWCSEYQPNPSEPSALTINEALTKVLEASK